MCSKLLCEFATQNNEQLIISYAEVHNLTNPQIAWSDMKNCKNVYCMHSKDIHFISVDLPLTDINETIEAWLFDDEVNTHITYLKSTKYSVSVLHLSFKLTDCIFVT
jgi:hypothetical protein